MSLHSSFLPCPSKKSLHENFTQNFASFLQEMQDLEAIVRSLMEDQGKLAVTCIGDTREMGGHAHGAPYVQDAPAPPPPPLGAPLTQPIPVVLSLLMLGLIFWIVWCRSFCWSKLSGLNIWTLTISCFLENLLMILGCPRNWVRWLGTRLYLSICAIFRGCNML